jgi:hypothetical protein
MQPAPLTTRCEQGVQQQQLRRRVCQQPSPELAKHAGVETGIIEWQAKRVLPVDSSTHSICGFAVGQLFSELHDADQCQPPRRFRRSATLRKQRGKHGVLVDRA